MPQDAALESFRLKNKICAVPKTSFLVFFLGFASLASACGANPPVKEQRVLSLSSTLTESCSGCHIENGTTIPSLKGWTTEALSESLKAYQGEGQSVMHRFARGLSAEDINLIAAYLGET